jgi:hypothetical protein
MPMSTQADPISEIVAADPIDLEALAAALDDSSHRRRVAATRGWTGDLQARLYDQCAGRSTHLEDLVPADTAPLTEVIHEGRNSLPVFNHFQKRFCAPSAEHASGEQPQKLWGYNEQSMRPFTGPGYFVAHEDIDAGEVMIDYRRVPPEAPADWPEVVPAEYRLGKFVYGGTVDRLRRVSEHVTIGRAFADDDEPMDNWFVLVRTP